MKFRNGFVSNSSSSSFVVFGVKLDSDVKSIEDYFGNAIAEDPGSFNQDGMGILEVDDCIYFGRILAEGEDSLDESETSAQELTALEEAILNNLEKVLMKDMKSIKPKVKLYTGTRPC